MDDLRARAEQARADSARIREQARTLRERHAGRMAGAEPHLSPREREVLLLLSAGLTTKEIAAQLRISRNTANYHLANLYRKLKARSRVDAVNAYHRLTAEPPA